MKQALLSLLIAVAIVGCYTQKKATEQTQKALIKYPEVVANVARTAFPCVTTKSDTIVTSKDSIIFIDCPDIGNGTAEDYKPIDFDNIPDSVKSKMGDDNWKIGMGDTKQTPLHIVGQPKKTIRVPVTIPVRTIYINTSKEDSAKIFLLTKEKEELKAASDKEIARLKAYGEKADRKIHKRNKAIQWLIILLLASLFGNYLQLKNVF